MRLSTRLVILRIVLALAASVALLAGIGCASKTSNIQTPEGRAAFYQNEVLLRIERFQTAAIQANQKSALPDSLAIPIVRFSVSAAKVIRENPTGWLATVTASWTEAKLAIPTPIKVTYQGYIEAIDVILATVATGKSPTEAAPITWQIPHLGGVR